MYHFYAYKTEVRTSIYRADAWIYEKNQIVSTNDCRKTFINFYRSTAIIKFLTL